jgi:hypothetical protein
MPIEERVEMFFGAAVNKDHFLINEILIIVNER